MGERPASIIDGKALVSNETQLPGGTIHNTVIVTPQGEVKNNHLSYTPNDGGKKVSVW